MSDGFTSTSTDRTASQTMPFDRAQMEPLTETILAWDLSTATGIPDVDNSLHLIDLLSAYGPLIGAEVQQLCVGWPKESQGRQRAEVILGEARRRISAQPVGRTAKEAAGRAQNLARLVRALHQTSDQLNEERAGSQNRPSRYERSRDFNR
ncbi:DUF6415 family natural product biosynthesis protein [Streptomyces sp. NPDC097610]|uniref:DUF6415 family natural product biosynthesis protein n=1 Tax=Streptomyces sp. NPDC097610 TaxID=3157227 RepID=UPI003318FC67